MGRKPNVRISNKILNNLPKVFFKNMPSTTVEKNAEQEQNAFRIEENLPENSSQSKSCEKKLPSGVNKTPSRYKESDPSFSGISEISHQNPSQKSSAKKALQPILEELLINKKGEQGVPKLNLDKLPVDKVESKNTKSTKETKTIRNPDSEKKEQEKVIVLKHRKYIKLRDVQQAEIKEKPKSPYLEKQAKKFLTLKKLTKNRRQLIEDTPYNKIKENSEESRERLRAKYGAKLTIEAKNKIKKDLVAGIQKIVDKKKLESPEMKIRQVKNIIKSNQNGIQRDTVSSYLRNNTNNIQTKVEMGPRIRRK